MIPTNNLSVFVRHNDTDLRCIVGDICSSFSFVGSVEDIVQDLYLKLLTSDILQNYNRYFYKGKPGHVQMSTYLYPIIKNHILSKIKSSDYRHAKYRQEWIEQDFDEVDDVEIRDAMPERTSALEHNDDEDGVDGLAFAFKEFAERFKKSHLNESVRYERGGAKPRTLLDIFHYMYLGYTNHQIAEIYGVSDMNISHTKAKLAAAMARFGLGSKVPQKRRSRKSTELFSE